MYYWAALFLLVALICGIFGFGGVGFASAGASQILFAIFLSLGIAALVARIAEGSSD